MLAAAASGAVVAGTALAVGTSPPSHRDAAAVPATAQAASRRAVDPAEPLRVLSISPGNSADPVTAADPVRVVFSAPLASTSPLPALSPAVAGRWQAAGGDAMVFTPSAAIPPTQEVTLRVPAGSAGVRSATGARLATPASAVFQAGGWSTLRLEQLLAQLGYLPLTWAPQGGSEADGGPVEASYAQQRGVLGAAGGTFSWQGDYPSALTRLWQPDEANILLTGALMAFQAARGLPMTAAVTPGLWQALLGAAAVGQRNPSGYSYALVTQTVPETMTVWHDGRIVMHGLANTGAPASPTVIGTFPVYLKHRYQVMRGLMPNGVPYADPVQFVSFFDGDYAVHSMDRASYGLRQSLGCVELPLTEARQVWPYLGYGSLVTVTG